MKRYQKEDNGQVYPAARSREAAGCPIVTSTYNQTIMTLYDGLKDAAKVLREADKLEQYKEIVDAMQKMIEMQTRIGELEDELLELKKVRDLSEQLEYQDKAYWLDEDGPFCSRCWDADKTLVRLRQQNDQKSDFDCDNCGVKNIRIFPELFVK